MEAAIIAPAIDLAHLARSIATIHVEYQDGERALDAAEKKTDGIREKQRERRLELGRLLIDAKRGIKHGGWLPYIEKLGVDRVRAAEWMREAGFVEEQVKCTATGNDVHLPNPANTRVAAGIDKRPRRRDEEPDPPAPATRDVEPAALFASWKRDISKALVGLDKMIMGYAKSWPKRSRLDLAKALRGVAGRIESMDGE